MKRCPECRRDYYDDSLLYCLDDGTALLEGPATLEPKTQALPATGENAENALTRPQYGSDADTGRFAPAFKKKRPLTALILAIAAFLILTVAGIGIYRYEIVTGNRSTHFQTVKVSRATNEGNIESAVISPDGKYIAYISVEGTTYGLWTKHLATNSRVQIASASGPNGILVDGFSPDGNYVLFALQEPQTAGADLYQIPVLGGPRKKIISNLAGAASASAISFDPSGGKFAFARLDPVAKLSSIWIANSDGSEERKLVERILPESIWSPSWSPDGRSIAASSFDGKFGCEIVNIDLASGIATPLGSKKFNFIGAVNWTSNGDLLFVAQENASEVNKIWCLPDPKGEIRVVTNDLNRYGDASLRSTKDGRSFVAVQQNTSSSIYVSRTGDIASAQQLSTRTGANDGVWGLSWDNSGRLFSVSEDENKSETWMFDASGTGKMVMEEAAIDSVNVTHDGRYLVFISRRTGNWDIWRSNIDGGDPKQLTNGENMASPGLGISPDDRWVYYADPDGNVRRASIDGTGSAMFIASPNSAFPQVSPDGTLIAFEDWRSQDHAKIQVYKIDGDSVKPFKTLEMPRTFVFVYRWSPDGRSIVYSDTIGRTSNLWEMPLEGGKVRQLTAFRSEIINNFSYSNDGKRLALARGPFTSDAVLISEAN